MMKKFILLVFLVGFILAAIHLSKRQAKTLEPLTQKDIQIVPELRGPIESSPEYQRGVQLQSEAAQYAQSNQTAKADSAYRESMLSFLKAAELHKSANISLAIWRIGMISKDMLSVPDYKTAYFCLRYQLLADPNGKQSPFSERCIQEIKQHKVLTEEEMQTIDKQVSLALSNSSVPNPFHEAGSK
jgi:hypothetical protein